MKTIFLSIIGSFIFCLQAANTFAQVAEVDSKWSLQLNVQQQDLAVQIPYGALGTVYPVGIRPFYSLDIQKRLKSKEKSHTFLSGQLGFYNNLYHERWMTAKIGFGREFNIASKWFASLRLEGGVARSKNSDVQYVYESGKWVPTDNYAKGSIDMLLAPRLDIGYRLIESEHALDAVMTSQLLMHVDTSLESGIPMYGLGVGLRLHL